MIFLNYLEKELFKNIQKVKILNNNILVIYKGYIFLNNNNIQFQTLTYNNMNKKNLQEKKNRIYNLMIKYQYLNRMTNNSN